jgi:hypothetical protein
MFNLDLLKNRQFATANIATFLSAIARGGIMIMLIVLLQGIWLPLHGYSYGSAPFWAGIFMIPMSIGIALTGPLSGCLSDKHGARLLATAGMVITGIAFLVFTLLPANFDYLPFAIILLVMGHRQRHLHVPKHGLSHEFLSSRAPRRSIRHACNPSELRSNHQPSNILRHNHNIFKHNPASGTFNGSSQHG